MKRILLFTENLGSGGAERQLTGLAVMLKQRGYKVKMLTYLDVNFHKRYLKENGVEHELDTRVLNRFSGLFYLYKNIVRFKPDTVISFLPGPNRRMCVLRSICKFNLVVSERSHTLQWNAMAKVRFLLYVFADKVVTNSFSELENITTHCGWLKSKSCAIPNYVDVDMFSPETKECGEVTRLLSIGRLIAGKNVIRILETLFELKQKGYRVNLTWVGAQYDKTYLSKVLGKIKELNLEDDVILKDQTDDVLSEYRKADIFCFPTLFEGYPNVLVEAMSCGLPVVCSNVCEMPNIVEDGVNGFLFKPCDVKDMVKTIEKMLALSADARSEMGILNRRKILENNSKERFVDYYVSII